VAGSEQPQRLKAELEAIRALEQESSLFDFDTDGDPPTSYTVTFRGKAIKRDLASKAEVEIHELHRCQIRLPYSFPERPPEIRWLTPIFHPNISFSGMIKLDDIGLPWDKDLHLDVICERLWDMARLAFVNLDKATNYSAKNWVAKNSDVRLPVDPRPLRGGPPPASSNVIRYQRRAGPVRPESAGGEEVFYIGEDTPTPELPKRRPPDEDDVLYIGDE